MARLVTAGSTIGVPTATYPTFGTLTLGVSDAWGNKYAMTCSHVVAASMNGDPKKTSVESPASSVQLAGTEVIGRVTAWLNLGPADNYADAGLVLINSQDIQISNSSIELAGVQYAINNQVTQFNDLSGQRVVVNSSQGAIDAIVDHLYDGVVLRLGRSEYSFSNVLAYRALSQQFQPGDSGGAVVDKVAFQFLGIHIGAAGDNQTGYCTIAPLIWTSFANYSLSFVA